MIAKLSPIVDLRLTHFLKVRSDIIAQNKLVQKLPCKISTTLRVLFITLLAIGTDHDGLALQIGGGFT